MSEVRLFQNLIKGFAAAHQKGSPVVTADEALILCGSVARSYVRDAAVIKLLEEGYIKRVAVDHQFKPTFRITEEGMIWCEEGSPTYEKRAKKKGTAPAPGDATLDMARRFAPASIFHIPKVRRMRMPKLIDWKSSLPTPEKARAWLERRFTPGAGSAPCPSDGRR